MCNPSAVVARVVMIAHGATAATRTTSFPLDEPVEPQAAGEARELRPALPIIPERAMVLTGPERRCRQTALHLGIGTAQTDLGLRDWQCGDWAGRSLAELASAEPGAVQQWLENPDYAPPRGERLTELLQRAGTWLDAREPSARVIAITHPALVRAVAVEAIGAGPASFWRVDVPPLGILELTGRPGHWSVRLR